MARNLDAGTSHVELGQRFYNPADGRLTQINPITQLNHPGDGNPYAYAADNPLNYADPTGASDVGACIAASILIGVTGAASVALALPTAGGASLVGGLIVATLASGLGVACESAF